MFNLQHQNENEMNTRLGIKNFRLFDAEGVEVDIKPLTILTGCNSSGKSSVVKAIILLNGFLRDLRNERLGHEPRLEFNKKPLSLLGNFDSILNSDSAQKGNRVVTLSYTLDDPYLGRDVRVEMSFASEGNDIRKDGFLNEVSVRDKDGEALYNGTLLTIDELFNVHLGKDRDFTFGDVWLGGAGSTSFLLKRRFFVYSCVCQRLDDYYDVLTPLFSNTNDVDVDDIADYLRRIKEKEGRDIIIEAIHFYSVMRKEKEYGKLFKAERSLVEVAMEADILTYLPLLRILDSIEKKDFRKRFLEMCGVKDGVKIQIIEDVVNEFEKSEFCLFSDYYRDVENRSLNKMIHPYWPSVKTSIESYKMYLDGYDIVDDSFWNEERVSLPRLFYLLTTIKTHPDDSDFVESQTDALIGAEQYREHKILRDFLVFRDTALCSVFLTDVSNLQYVGSNRIDVKRLYSFENQDNFGVTVSEYFEAIRTNTGWNNDSIKPGAFIDKWIRKFGIGYHFGIESVANGVGMALKIYKDEDDKKGCLLADYGYGISQLISVLLEIQTAIMKGRNQYRKEVMAYKLKVKLNPLLEGSTEPRPEDVESKFSISIAIEEPEIHLHPKYQSLLADMFLDAYQNHGIHFLIETHSEYLIRKLQTFVGKKIISPDTISILYAEENPAPGEDRIRRIGIKDDGRLESAFGSGFFDEADSLAMDLLKIKGGLT